MPKIEYKTKNFSVDRLSLVEQINNVIDDYSAQGYNLTLRQVYYQMVARAIIPNNERSYKNLGVLISDARLAGFIDWNAIEDRTRNLQGRSHWQTPGNMIDSAAYSYHLDYWNGQRNYVEVWVEKDALIGIVGQICQQLDVNFFSCRGYVSQSEMWGAARRLKRRQDMGQQIILLHLGDHDPSGKDMSRDIQERLITFETYGVEFHRLALNMDQVELYGPPPNPTKITDSRAGNYIREFGHDCWELDALEPQVISELIGSNVQKYRNDKLYRAVLKQEREEKGMLEEVALHWGEIADNWDDIKERYC
ncbi:hypothetical protein [Desulfosporosinus sp. FKA]|uniref:hypothetical protein n=1 Tax=Desulfosporosinus sp. FKA TaxID=1969834 RepID=UPI000B4A38ED|nr:hypothetical protein [Desulfosporosinus sp. FKA]